MVHGVSVFFVSSDCDIDDSRRKLFGTASATGSAVRTINPKSAFARIMAREAEEEDPEPEPSGQGGQPEDEPDPIDLGAEAAA